MKIKEDFSFMDLQGTLVWAAIALITAAVGFITTWLNKKQKKLASDFELVKEILGDKEKDYYVTCDNCGYLIKLKNAVIKEGKEIDSTRK